MVIMVLEKVPPALRGDLTRWLFEIKSGVYVGHVNAMVRDRLWQRCNDNRKAGGIFQAWSTNNEQHFQMRIAGMADRSVVDWEGLSLILEANEELPVPKKRRIRETGD